jgi:hypothetical protein
MNQQNNFNKDSNMVTAALQCLEANGLIIDNVKNRPEDDLLQFVKKPVNYSICPQCGSRTETWRHPFAKVWCPSCEFVLREEGQR